MLCKLIRSILLLYSLLCLTAIAIGSASKRNLSPSEEFQLIQGNEKTAVSPGSVRQVREKKIYQGHQPKELSAPLSHFPPLQEDIWTRMRFKSSTPLEFGGVGAPGKVYNRKPSSAWLFAAAEWKMMRPSVNCSNDLMTFTLQGSRYSHLFVDRVDGPPIRLTKITPSCCYSLATTWSGLVLKVPYDGCHVKREGDRYVLRLLWRGNRVLISCPVVSVPKPKYPSLVVRCTLYGMAVKIAGSQEGTGLFQAKAGSTWVPLVSRACAYRANSLPREMALFAPYSAPCVAFKDGVNLLVVRFRGKELPLPCALPAPHPPIPPYPPPLPLPPPASHPSHRKRLPTYTPIPFPHQAPINYTICYPHLGNLCIPRVPHPYLDPYHTPLLPTTPAPTSQPVSMTTGPLKDAVVLSLLPNCSVHRMVALLPVSNDTVIDIKVKDVTSNAWVSLASTPVHCGYEALLQNGSNLVFSSPLPACHSYDLEGLHRIRLKYQTLDEQWTEIQLSCPVPVIKEECKVPGDQRLSCGSGLVSAVECIALGCCFCSETQDCYYPMDACTVDHHFVFSVPASLTEPPLALNNLVVGSNTSCTPQKVTASHALFKIPLDGCGSHRYEVGETVVYMLEVLNSFQAIGVKPNTITTDCLFRFLVECRYPTGSVYDAGHMVKSPSLGAAILAQGEFAVELRIAKDHEHSDYYPQYHQPLRMLLGKPLYLEVRLLNASDADVVLFVHYCVAYPRSAQSIWVLNYNGHPNPLDSTTEQTPPPPLPPRVSRHINRFTVTTFQFLQGDHAILLDEEIYFMCSTEILPSYIEGSSMNTDVKNKMPNPSGSPT